jgi:hypothetical protein
MLQENNNVHCKGMVCFRISNESASLSPYHKKGNIALGNLTGHGCISQCQSVESPKIDIDYHAAGNDQKAERSSDL